MPRGEDPQAFAVDSEDICPRCGYALRGLIKGTYPECGLSVGPVSVARLNALRSARWAGGLNAVMVSTALFWAAGAVHMACSHEYKADTMSFFWTPIIVTALGVPIVGMHVIVRPQPGPRAAWRNGIEVVTWAWAMLVTCGAIVILGFAYLRS